jgi:hypothetical protein
MSDFGTFITATKTNDGSISESEISMFSDALEKLILEEEYCTVIGSMFEHTFEIESHKKSAIAVLSNHFYTGYAQEDWDAFEFVRAEELIQAEEICKNLNAKFSGYKFSSTVDEY